TFRVIVNDPDTILDPVNYEVTEIAAGGQEVWTSFYRALVVFVIKNFRRRMTPQPLKIRADTEMKCFQFDGVFHIK
ncbi:Eukaryotic translation initiation factor 2 subunit alpha-like protein, partial [Bienertia sinuspersici]